MPATRFGVLSLAPAGRGPPTPGSGNRGTRGACGSALCRLRGASRPPGSSAGGTRDPSRCLRPPLHPFRGPRGPVPDRISGEASLSDACGLSRDDARKHPIHPGSEAAGTHPKPAEAAPLGPGAKACWGCRIAFGQDHGFCGQRGALGSLSASSIFQLGDLGQGT